MFSLCRWLFGLLRAGLCIYPSMSYLWPVKYVAASHVRLFPPAALACTVQLTWLPTLIKLFFSVNPPPPCFSEDAHTEPANPQTAAKMQIYMFTL